MLETIIIVEKECHVRLIKTFRVWFYDQVMQLVDTGVDKVNHG